MLNTPFAPWPSFSEREIEAAANVLRSGRVNYWTGKECHEFETAFAQWSGARYAVAVSNGTVALDLALHAVGIRPGDEVVVTSRTFIASASCVANIGARPVFADVDLDSQNITAESVRRVLSPRTRAVICVHFAGWPCEMDAIMKLAQERDLKVIEDCAQAHGAAYRGRRVGSIGHVGAWSFCQDKIMTTGGEGGMLTTNDQTIWQNAWSYKDHGKAWDAVHNAQPRGGFRYVHESFGTNARLTEIQAAIGRIQLDQMPAWHLRRRRNAHSILSAARSCAAFRVPDVPSHVQHAWYKAYFFADSGKLRRGWDRDRILEEINGHGVPCAVGGCAEVYLEKAFDDVGLRPVSRLPAARSLGETSLMFMVHPTLTAEDIAKTCQVIQDVGHRACASKFKVDSTPLSDYAGTDHASPLRAEG